MFCSHWCWNGDGNWQTLLVRKNNALILCCVCTWCLLNALIQFFFFWGGGVLMWCRWQARGLLRLWYFGMIPVGERSVEIMSTTLFDNSMEQIQSREANRFSAIQEIPHILWNPKVHYHIHQSPPRDPVLSQINPVLAPPPPQPYVLKVHFTIIRPSTSGFSQVSLWLGFPHQNPVNISHLPHAC